VTVGAPSVRSILAALDESARAELVFETARSLARDLDAQLFLIRVLVIPPDLPAAAHTHPDGLEGHLERTTRAELHARMKAEPGVSFGPPIVVTGDPWHRIVETAKTLDVDLIVIGSHRYHGPVDRALGTVAAKVVNHADRDVLVVNERGVDRNTRP
jgi:nucleotide-binding universal stress UspA family protein